MHQSKLICIRFIVSGKVQGVWFRAGTKQQADQLGVTGFAHNLPNGDVDIVACGTPEALGTLHTWLKQGPEHARVDNLTTQDMPLQSFSGFKIG